MRLGSGNAGPPATTYAGLDWQGIAIDRSQAFGAVVNLATISRGAGGGAPVTTRWSALQGGGTEAQALQGGALCNAHTGPAWRALQYALPINVSAPSASAVGAYSDIYTLDVLLVASAGGTATGVFLLQWDGTVASIKLPGVVGAAGIGFLATNNSITLWSSNLGNIATFNSLTPGALVRCILTITAARGGGGASYTATINGAAFGGGPLVPGAISNGPNQGYSAGLTGFVPVVSASAGSVLYVADCTILNSAPGYL